MEVLDDLILDTIKRLRKNNQQPNDDKSYKLLATENEKLTEEQLDERLVKFTENIVL